MNIVQIYKKFPTEDDCLEYLEQVRWKGKPTCPYCKSQNSSKMKKEHRYHCNLCNTSYSVTVKTIFHKTHVDFQKWFLAISIIINAKKNISARQLARDIVVHRNTAWSMAMRIRKAMLTDRQLLFGLIEMDETYVGGMPRKNHAGKGSRNNKIGRSTKKIPVVGMVQSKGNVHAFSAKSVDFPRLMMLVGRNVDDLFENTLSKAVGGIL